MLHFKCLLDNCCSTFQSLRLDTIYPYLQNNMKYRYGENEYSITTKDFTELIAYLILPQLQTAMLLFIYYLIVYVKEQSSKFVILSILHIKNNATDGYSVQNFNYLCTLFY